MIAGVSNASIVHVFDHPDGSGVITYTDVSNTTDGAMLQITFNNTSASNMSSLITGLAFDVVDDINSISAFSFVDGDGNDISSYYGIGLDVNSSFVSGNTLVDVEFGTINGVNGGIFNDDGNSGNLSATMFPDIAILILEIDDPADWSLSEINNDILRMQQTGTDGEGSLKLPPVPVPAAVWLFGSGLIGLVGVARRKSRA